MSDKLLWPLYEETLAENRVYSIQINQLRLTVSMQKLVLKNMHRVQRYWQKCVKFCWFGLECWFLTVFGNKFGLGEYFSKPIFALKPWDWAGRFENHEPYNLNDFFLTYKGVREILRQPPPQAKGMCHKHPFGRQRLTPPIFGRSHLDPPKNQ